MAHDFKLIFHHSRLRRWRQDVHLWSWRVDLIIIAIDVWIVVAIGIHVAQRICLGWSGIKDRIALPKYFLYLNNDTKLRGF